ncbi:MAG: OB-fold nucleic acid binding domain-containing protein, partial [Patescibacteria group bacterium]
MSESELDQIKYRKAKREQLTKSGVLPYPARVKNVRTHLIEKVLADYDQVNKANKVITLVGRVVAIRLHGSICFGNIMDYTGNVQFSIMAKDVGNKYEDWKSFIDLGDIVSITGKLEKTNRGEITLILSDYSLLSKALVPLPDKRQGVKDVETRLRHRELDLISNEEVRNRFIT